METIKVVKYSNSKIINLNTGKPILVVDIYRLYRSGESVSYTDAVTNEDLLKPLIKRNKGRHRIKIRILKEHEELEMGPEEPLINNKKFNCQKCGDLTINRFRCSPCWEKEPQTDMGDFNYL